MANIHFTYKIAAPGSVSSTTYPNLARLKSCIMEQREAQFVVTLKTRTSLGVELTCPRCEDAFLIGYIPQGAEKYSFLQRTERAIFDAKPVRRHYFRLTKSQGLREFLSFLTLVLEELLPEEKELRATLFMPLPVLEALDVKALYFFHGSLAALQEIETKLQERLLRDTEHDAALSMAHEIVKEAYGSSYTDYSLNLDIRYVPANTYFDKYVEGIVAEKGLCEEALEEYDGSGDAQGWTAFWI